MTAEITRRQFTRSLVALAAAGVAGGPALTACGSSQPVTGTSPAAGPIAEPVTIEYWHINSQALGGATVKQFVGDFQRQQPRVTVQERFQAGQYAGLLKNLQTALAAGRPPDVAQIGYTYLDYVARNFPFAGADQLARTHGDQPFFDAFNASALALGRVGGRQVAMPYAISDMVAYFNADLLKRAGVDPSRLPTTWDGWRRAGQAVKGVTGKPALYIGFSTGDTWAMQTLMESNGARLLTCRGSRSAVSLDDTRAVQAVQFWADMIKEGVALNALRDQGQQAFLSGAVAVCFEAISARQGFQQQAAFDLRAAPCPTFGSRPARLAAGGNVLFVFARDPARQRAAWEFIKFLESPRSLTDWTRGTGYLPPRKGLTEDARYLGSFLRDNPIEAVGAREAGSVVPWTSFPGPDGLNAQNLLFEAVQKSLGGQASARQALGDANAQVADLLRGATCA